MLKNFLRGLQKPKKTQPIIIVSGLPRSGTSMMMKLLNAGGLPLLIDNVRKADTDNPNGYFEFERVKNLPTGDITWLGDAQGKVVKVIAALLVYLPNIYDYQVIFMQRAMPEILASQRTMLIRKGEDPNTISDDTLTVLYEKHLAQVNDWIKANLSVRQIDVNYNIIMENPFPEIERINRFLGNTLDVKKMNAIIDPQLYRQRRTEY